MCFRNSIDNSCTCAISVPAKPIICLLYLFSVCLDFHWDLHIVHGNSLMCTQECCDCSSCHKSTLCFSATFYQMDMDIRTDLSLNVWLIWNGSEIILLPGTRGLLFTAFLISTVWLHFIRINSWKMSPFCFSNTPDVTVVFVLLPPWLNQGGCWLTVPERGQVASLTDSLICCILHCCSSPANRGN